MRPPHLAAAICVVLAAIGTISVPSSAVGTVGQEADVITVSNGEAAAGAGAPSWAKCEWEWYQQKDATADGGVGVSHGWHVDRATRTITLRRGSGPVDLDHNRGRQLHALAVAPHQRRAFSPSARRPTRCRERPPYVSADGATLRAGVRRGRGRGRGRQQRFSPAALARPVRVEA